MAAVGNNVNPEREMLYPLSEFYARWGLPLPDAVEIEGDAMPQPYRSLLVHERDMTPTLEAAHAQNTHLHTLDKVIRSHVLSRQVVLVLEDDKTVVEMGAIKIYLGRFPLDARSLINECHVPLGTILKNYRIIHETQPELFFQAKADSVIAGRLEVDPGTTVYGRRAELRDKSRQTLARVIEILPPSAGIEGPGND